MGVAIALLVLTAEPRWGLTFKSADGCISASELAEAVEKRLGHPTFGAQPDLRIEGYLRADGPRRWRARLTLVDGEGTVKGSREVTQEGASCRAIDEALKLVTAMMIDPAAAQPGAPQPPAPPRGLDEPEVTGPPPPPPSEPAPPPPLLAPRVPPREEWPGRLVVDAGNFTQNGRWLSRSSFYRVVGRPDLDQAYAQRSATKALAYVLGSVAMSTGAVLMLLQATSTSCVRWSGTPDLRGDCLEKASWPLVSGGVVLGVGLAAVLFAAIFRSVPTTATEDLDLADTYNARLEPPQLPATASRW